MCTQSKNTETLWVCQRTDGAHARTGGQKREEGACREKAAKVFLPTQRSCLLQEPQQGRERANSETLHVATAKSATEQRREEGEPNTRERRRRKKALTGLSMSAVRAGLGPGARQPRRQRGLPGVDDHASITMSQVGQAAKSSNKCTELPF